MTEKVGHTAVAVLQDRRSFTKGGLSNVNDPGEGPEGEGFLAGVNRLIETNKGQPISMSDYRNALAAEQAVPGNKAVANLVAKAANLPLKRTQALLLEMAQSKAVTRGLLARRSQNISSPFASPDPTDRYKTFASDLRRKLRQEGSVLPIESETS